MKLVRFLPFSLPIVLFILSEAFFFQPKIFYLNLIIINSLFFLGFWYLEKSLWNKISGRLLLSLVVFVNSAAAYSLILPNKAAIQIVFFIELIVVYFYFRLLLSIRLASIPPTSLKNIYTYSNFLAFFFVAATVYGLQSFLNASIFLLILAFSGVAYLILSQPIFEEENAGLPLVYKLVSLIILVEIGWTIFFLPINFNTAAIILSIIYYVIMNLNTLSLTKKITRKNVQMYLTLGSLAVILILLTSKWI